MRKETYASPRIEVIELENEATVMTGSVTSNGFTDGGSGWKSSGTNSYHSASPSSNELDDMITNILTVGE